MKGPATQYETNFPCLINSEFYQKRGFVKCHRSRKKWLIGIHWQQQKRVVGKFKEKCQLPGGVIPLLAIIVPCRLPGGRLNVREHAQRGTESSENTHLPIRTPSHLDTQGPRWVRNKYYGDTMLALAGRWEARFLLFQILLSGKNNQFEYLPRCFMSPPGPTGDVFQDPSGRLKPRIVLSP
uniref:Uncharacterized protein n=1 Tax=Rousettus aegyptiacus TaxID=9407 RepID=A0A7J8C2L1_ROUAE|nr:hypothetical protein HJG63_009374 [Rousettus aegyptiacus]